MTGIEIAQDIKVTPLTLSLCFLATLQSELCEKVCPYPSSSPWVVTAAMAALGRPSRCFSPSGGSPPGDT